jgi:RHS repeat-associated protein
LWISCVLSNSGLRSFGLCFFCIFGDYLYSFNGKEHDPEVSGDGNSYDYGFRIYNPMIGKFLSVDPFTPSKKLTSASAFVGIAKDGSYALLKIGIGIGRGSSITVTETEVAPVNKNYDGPTGHDEEFIGIFDGGFMSVP